MPLCTCVGKSFQTGIGFLQSPIQVASLKAEASIVVGGYGRKE